MIEKGKSRREAAGKAQESVDQHHASPMMETIAKLWLKYDLHMRVERRVPDKGSKWSTLNALKEECVG